MLYRLSIMPLNFEPTDEEQTLIDKAARGDNDAVNVLAYQHSILYYAEPGKKGWVQVVDVDSQELTRPIRGE